MKSWSRIVLLAGCFAQTAMAGTSVYTEQGIVSNTQTVNQVTDTLLDRIRLDALNQTGVYIKKVSVMDGSQNLSETTRTTVARLIKVDNYTTQLAPNNGPVPSQILTVTATVSVDDNELKVLVANEHELDIVRRQKAALQNQVTALLKENSNKTMASDIAEAKALAESVPQRKTTGGPNITLEDLVADVPMPQQKPEHSHLSYNQACAFFKEVAQSIQRASFQNNLNVTLGKVTGVPGDYKADVVITGNVTWDWSKQIDAMVKFFGKDGFIKVFGNKAYIDFDYPESDAYIDCFGSPNITVSIMGVMSSAIIEKHLCDTPFSFPFTGKWKFVNDKGSNVTSVSINSNTMSEKVVSVDFHANTSSSNKDFYELPNNPAAKLLAEAWKNGHREIEEKWSRFSPDSNSLMDGIGKVLVEECKSNEDRYNKYNKEYIHSDSYINNPANHFDHLGNPF